MQINDETPANEARFGETTRLSDGFHNSDRGADWSGQPQP
jgi:hypothetical protein